MSVTTAVTETATDVSFTVSGHLAQATVTVRTPLVSNLAFVQCTVWQAHNAAELHTQQIFTSRKS